MQAISKTDCGAEGIVQSQDVESSYKVKEIIFSNLISSIFCHIDHISP